MLRSTFVATTAVTAIAAGIAFAGDQAAKKSIVETAQEAGDFSTLLTAVETADLGETLSGEGPFTVFAPTDEAFSALDDGAVEDLLKEENRDQLTSVLTYHVVPAAAMAGDLSDGQELETVNGEMLTVSIDGDTVMVGDATVTQADIEAANGVIHVIDTVMMPGGGGA